MTSDAQTDYVRILANEHLDPDGSIVKSGVNLADAVLAEIEKGCRVVVSLDGFKAISSSFFNVFLRRIDEACGLAEFDKSISFQFRTRIQKMIFQRSYDAIQAGPKNRLGARPDYPNVAVDSELRHEHVPWWKRLFRLS